VPKAGVNTAHRMLDTNPITTIGRGTFNRLANLARLYAAIVHAIRARLHDVFSRDFDTVLVTKAPFDILTGTPLVALYDEFALFQLFGFNHFGDVASSDTHSSSQVLLYFNHD
jgi:hypothetical protein